MNIRQRLFAYGAAGARLSESAGRGLLYLTAGTLRQRDIRDMSRRAWQRVTSDPEDLHRGFDPWEEKVYWPWINAGDRVCVVGAGSGRDVLPFLDAGHDVVGVESSPQPAAILRAILRERRCEQNVVEAFIEDAVLPGTFDAVIFSVNCYSFIQGVRTRISVLKKLARHLNPGGRILLSYRQREGHWTVASIRLAAVASRVTRSDWRMEPYDTIGSTKAFGALVFEHLFMPAEVEHEGREAGLRVIKHDWQVQPPFAVLGL